MLLYGAANGVTRDSTKGHCTKSDFLLNLQLLAILELYISLSS